MTSVAAFAQRA